jgi:farnesyl diphosphate synthase
MNNLDAFLTDTACRVERALDAALPAVDCPPLRLHAAMRHAVFAGGKRLRPALLRAACLACGGTDADAESGMVAIELLHTYTLVHDDLPAMDDDHWRRGRPTVHVAYDEATAILVGDALQAAAFVAVSDLGLPAVRQLGAAAGSVGVVGGQQDDLDAERDRIAADADVLLRIHQRKTAALIAAATKLGAVAAQADSATVDRLGQFGEALGLAFQLVDDCLDVTADRAALGKTPGKDAQAGKLTWVTLYGLDAARQEACRQQDQALQALAGWDERAALLRQLAAFVLARAS